MLRGMDEGSPADIIRRFSQSPGEAREALQGSFNNDELTVFRDGQYNNLIHIAVQQLADQPESYSELEEGYKSLVRYLVGSGIGINEVNDERDSPLILMYKATADLRFIDFLEDELGAKPTYTTLAPEIRALKNNVKVILSYCCPCFGKQKQN